MSWRRPDDPVAIVDRLDAGEEDVDGVVAWLEDDLWAFRTGYARAKLFRRLAIRQLTPAQAARLRVVLLRQVDAGPRWELREACTLARSIADAEMKTELRARLRGDDPAVAMRALTMLLRLRRGLRESDRSRARVLLVEWASGPDAQLSRTMFRPRGPMSDRVRRLWTPGWGQELLAAATARTAEAGRARRIGARRLLASVPVLADRARGAGP